MFLLPWSPKRCAFMANRRHSKGRHRGLRGQLPQTPPLDPPLSLRWLVIAASPLPPLTAKGAGFDSSRTASQRNLSWHSFSSTYTVYLWAAKHRHQKVRPTYHACYWRLVGSGRSTDQGHGNRRCVPPAKEAKAEHYKTGVGILLS